MKRKNYERPTMQVVELQHRTHLLVGSAKRGPMDDPDDYLNEDDPFNF